MSQKDLFAPRSVRSRRSRPAKPPLSQETIISVALDLLQEEGLAGLSLRRIAQRLHTGPASLYVYVDNLESLQAIALDRALADVDVSGGDVPDWRGRLRYILASYTKVLARRPGLGHLAMNTMATGPNAFRMWEALLRELHLGGIPVENAIPSLDALLLHMTAIVAEQDNHRGRQVFSRVNEALRETDGERYPFVRAALGPILGSPPEERFAWILDFLVNAVANSPRNGG